MQSTKTFRQFEESFKHIFDECERGFTNEFIIRMFCQIFIPGKTVINYKVNVKEIYLTKQGTVECFNNDKDELMTNEPIMYLPKYSYFGDYQILKPLKSNIIFKSLGCKD